MADTIPLQEKLNKVQYTEEQARMEKERSELDVMKLERELEKMQFQVGSKLLLFLWPSVMMCLVPAGARGGEARGGQEGREGREGREQRPAAQQVGLAMLCLLELLGTIECRGCDRTDSEQDRWNYSTVTCP